MRQVKQYKESENAALMRVIGIILTFVVVVAYFSGAFDGGEPVAKAQPTTAEDVWPLIAQSDDIEQRRELLTTAAIKLIDEGRCTPADFTEVGGFVRSTNHPGGVYFTYCGGMTLADRVYVDIRGDIYYRDYPL